MFACKCKTQSNFKSVLDRLGRKAQAELNAIANESAGEISREIDSGAHGLMTDTGASAASIYAIRMVQGTQQSDYSEALGAMSQHYLTRYNEAHLQSRTLAPYALTMIPGIRRSAIASASKVVAFWEDGHINAMTGQFEQVPLFYGKAVQRRRDMRRRFIGILGRSYRR